MSLLTGKGINAQRKILGDRNTHDSAIKDFVTTQPIKFFYRAVIDDVIFDPVNMAHELSEKYADKLSNPELLLTAPRNSVIAKLIGDSANKRNDDAYIIYPMISHIHLPLKSGEKIWVFFENENKEIGYWISRIVERRDVDDPNFTHGDRIFVDQQQPSTMDRANNRSTNQEPYFPNGSDTKEGFTLNDPEGYEEIHKNSIANRVSTFEPVPRYNKRPSDHVIEGSNNTLIVLGEDRTTSTGDLQNKKFKGKSQKDKKNAAGMIDVVVGRGRKLPAPGSKPQLTAPGVIKNSRGFLETDKSFSKENQAEGDLDFENDAARITAFQNVDVDEKFGKQLPKLNSNKDVEKFVSVSAVVAKADNIRIISREDGSIRIVKEGVENDETGKGRAVILIEKDGTIMIDSPTIIIGSGIEKNNGQGTQLYFGRDAVESTVLGDTLKELLTTYSTNTQSAVDSMSQAITTFCDSLSTPPNNLGNFGLPIAGLTVLPPALKTQIETLKSKFDSDTQTFKNDLIKILSKIGKTK